MNTFEVEYSHLNGRFKSVLNPKEAIYVVLKDSAVLTLSVYNQQELRRKEEGSWTYRSDHSLT